MPANGNIMHLLRPGCASSQRLEDCCASPYKKFAPPARY
jgi:hypothetical protein